MSKAVKAVSSVVTAITKPFQKVFGLLMPKVPNAAGSGMSGSELKQIIRSSKEPARYVFGEVGTGALLAWAQEEPGEQDEGERLYLVYVLTEGTIESLDQIYVNQEPVATAGDLIEYELVSGATAPNQYMLEHSPDWRDTMIGRGLTWVRVTLKYDPEYFASGIPDLLFEYRARNDIYDPRSTGTGYSDNAALVILWYVRHRLQVPDDEILWDTFIDAANICDEAITNPDGSRERRYTVSGGFRADERKDRVLADLMAACAGSLLRVGGKIGLQVGAYYGPAEFTIDEDMVIGTVTGQTEVSRADAVNTMRGTFVSREQRWVETDYPAVSVAEWVEEDGGQIEDSLNLRLVSSPYQAQRLANIELRRKRAGGRLELPLNFRGYACRPGRVVRVDLPSLNIQGEFAVVDWDFSGDNGCKVKLRAEQPEIYDDAVGQPFDATNFIRLPTGGIGSPTGLRFVVENVGEVVQGVLLWNPVDAALHYNVVIKHDNQAVQSAQVPAGVERCEIGGLISGNYVAEVRARGRLGLSGPASINFTVLAPPTPDSVAFTRGNHEITLIPRLTPGASLGGGYFRYYVTQSEGATQPQADYLGEGLSFTHTGLAPATRYYYYVQSVNAYGVSPFLRVSIETTNNFQEVIELIEGELRRPGGVLEQFEGEITENSEAIASAQKTIDEAQQSIAELKAEIEALDPEDQGARIDELQQIVEREEKMQIIRYLGIRVQAMNGAAQQDTDRIVEANDRFSISQRVDILSTDYQGNKANVREELTALSQADLALARSVDELSTDYQGNKASVDQRLTALSDKDSALAQSLENYRVEVEDEFAEVSQQLTAVYDPAKGAVARAVTTVSINGKKAMIGMQVDGTTAEIVAVANTFAVLNPINGQTVTAFVVSDGRVIIPEAFIDRLTITKLRASDGSLAFQDGKLRADLIDVDNLNVKSAATFTGGAASSDWPRSGWALNPNGDFGLKSASGGDSMEQNPSGLRFFQNGVMVVEIGRLS